mgnify:CR=1 FL=1
MEFIERIIEFLQNYQMSAIVGDIVSLCSDGFSARFVAVGSINKLHLACTVAGLVLGKHPDICTDARVHKLVGGKLNNGIKPVIFKYVTADFRRS